VLYKKGETNRFKTTNRIFEAAVKGVNSAGELILQTSMEEHYNFGQLQWL
jgi:hypothetical protein